MALKIRYSDSPSNTTLAYSIERMGDSYKFDHGDSTFKVTPATGLKTLPESGGSYSGLYAANISSTPTGQFTDGYYAIYIHDTGVSSKVISILQATFIGGSDNALSTGTITASVDSGVIAQAVWQYPTGATVATRIDTTISSRSSFNYASNQVIVATNNDKSGYALSTSGVDSITVETGINMRQAFAPILAANAGAITVAGSNFTIKSASGNITRITATADASGNRSSIGITFPT